MKKGLATILLINFCAVMGGELPKQMLFVNLPDLAQQKLSISFLNRTKQNNYWQFDAAFRQIYTYEEYFSNDVWHEPHYVEALSPMGFHVFAGVGYKYIKASNTVQSKVRYWQPQLVLKMAEERQIVRVVRFVDNGRSSYNNRIYNQYYSAGFELNNGRLKQGRKLMTDLYWGVGFKINCLQYEGYNYRNYSPDFLYHATPIQHSRQWSFSPYINLGIRFGKSL